MGKLTKLKNIVKDKNRKSIIKILIESIHAGIIEKEIPIFYFYNLLYKKKSGDYKNFIGRKKRKKIQENYYSDYNMNLRDKVKFNQIATSNNINTPKTLAYSITNTIFLNQKSIYIKNKNQLNELLEELIKISKNKSVFIKPSDGSGGLNAFRISIHDLNENNITKLFDLMSTNNFVFQETIVQHNSITKIYPNSINSIRVYSYRNKDTNNIEIVSALMRFGFNGSVVDNGSSGNMFVSIDTDNNWELSGHAYTFFENGGASYEKHPDTKVTFNGIELPYQKETIETIKKAANLFTNEYIGWDIAITPNGPIIIEGNDRPNVIMTQIACGGFKNHPKFKKIFGSHIL